MIHSLWGCIDVFGDSEFAVLKPSVQKSNAKQLVINFVDFTAKTNNITDIKIYCVFSRQSQIPQWSL